MKTYVTKSKKSPAVQKMINEALEILESVGIPLEGKTERGMERMALCFLAVASVTGDWAKASASNFYKTREIISYVNANFEENISPGSYDDIRRKDLKLLVLADLVVNSGEKQLSATNDPTRGYSLSDKFRNLIVHYGTETWEAELRAFVKTQPPLADVLNRKRSIKNVPVKLPQGIELHFSSGEHNILQKKIIEEFLPRFGNGCLVLYIGDTANKLLHIDEEKLKRLNFFTLSHDELPDIVAYDPAHNWLYLIEAVYSSGTMSEIRVHELKKLLENCKADLIFVTAFLKRDDFRKWSSDIAWETEVWIADNPDHLIHFNGTKYLGPHKS
ncbi:MAG: restriction endonuclease [Spirochaetes bacterium]|nr:restriction endonuclease [Spirochaetota bacterium]